MKEGVAWGSRLLSSYPPPGVKNKVISILPLFSPRNVETSPVAGQQTSRAYSFLTAEPLLKPRRSLSEKVLLADGALGRGLDRLCGGTVTLGHFGG